MEIDVINKVCQCVDELVLGNTEAYEQLMYALIISGLAMQIIGSSRPASGAEHHMSHLWEMEVINEHLNAYHGERVSVALILVMEEYEKIKKAIENERCRVKKYSGLEVDMLKEVFRSREMYNSIIKENTPDPLLNVNKVILQNRLENISEILEKLPTLDFVKNTLMRAKAVTSFEEIGLPKGIKEKSLRVSPYMSNRITLMRLSKMLEY